MRAWREFVDQQASIGEHEELYAKDADHIQFFKHRARDLDSVALRPFVHVSRRY